MIKQTWYEKLSDGVIGFFKRLFCKHSWDYRGDMYYCYKCKGYRKWVGRTK